jgi:acyl carrier protein
MTEHVDDLKREVKMMIMNTLGIQDINPDEIDDNEPLFGGKNKLTLDSVDALEIIMAIQRTYGVRIADQAAARYTLRSISSISEFILIEQNKK